MKRLIITLSCGFLSVLAYGQSAPEFRVSEEKRAMSRGEQNAFTVEIPGASVKNLEEAWSKYYRQNAKARFSKKGDEYVAEKVVGSRIASDTVSIFIRQAESESGTRLFTFVEYGDHFLSTQTDPEKAVILQKIMGEIANDTYRIVVGEELDAEEKKLKSLQKDLDDLIKAHDKMHKTISDNQAEIADNNVKIRNLEMQLGRVVERDNAGNLVPSAPAAPLDEKTRKSLEKDEKKLRNDILKMESEIRQAERDIPVNEQEQERKREEVTAQAEVVRQVQAKLQAIP
jgi:hypothetical protein